MTTIKLFTAVIAASNEHCVSMPGFSHWSQPRLKYSGDKASPMVRTIYFGAKSRTHAAKQIGNICGIHTPCELSEGQKSSLITESMAARVSAYK